MRSSVHLSVPCYVCRGVYGNQAWQGSVYGVIIYPNFKRHPIAHWWPHPQRAETFLKLIREYARGKSFSLRMGFAEVARCMVRMYSSRFVKDWVFDLSLELLYDPVPNVRLQVCEGVHALRTALLCMVCTNLGMNVWPMVPEACIISFAEKQGQS